MDWDSYERHLADPETLDLCRRIRAVDDPEVEAEYPANMSGSARIHVGGRVLERMVVIPKGEPGNFVSDAELRAKFDGLTAPYLDAARREALGDRLLALSEEGDIAALLRLTVPQAAGTLRVASGGGD